MNKITLTLGSLAVAASFQSAATEVSGAVTAFYLNTPEDHVGSEFIGVLDVDVEGKIGAGRWHMYVEGTTTSRSGKVTDTYGESLADAGGASDDDGDGRVQISTLEYYLPVAGGELVMGLLYPSGFTESGDWSNDETSQFVSSSFVNIQTSGAPDYAFGLGYMAALTDNLSTSILISQAQGLGDLDARYSTLVDEWDDYFISTELVWSQTQYTVHASIWASTLKDDEGDKNYGVNLSASYGCKLGTLIARFGLANEDASDISHFAGLSLQKSWNKWGFGAGVSRSWASDELAKVESVDDTTQLELYAKRALSDHFHVTGSVQHIQNSDLGRVSGVDDDPTIATLRASYEF